MLHHTQKKAAIKKLADHASDPVEDMKAAIKEDYPEATEEEMEEIMKGAKETVPEQARLTPDQIQPNGMRKNHNEKIIDRLKSFDYENLIGEKFKEYCLFVQSLQLDTMYDFEQYLVEVVKKVRYRGVKDSPTDVIGFRLVNSKPIHTTRIPVKIALINNGSVRQDEGENFFETIGSQIEHNGKQGRYYLLKK